MPESSNVQFTVYLLDTGEILYHGTCKPSLLHAQNTGIEGSDVVQGGGASDTHWVDSGVLAERPSLGVPETEAAPLDIDLAFLPSPATLRNEAGDTVQCQGPETLVDPGTYWIEPPFPWRSQVVVLS